MYLPRWGQCIHFFRKKKMSLFTKLAPLVQAGVVVHLTLRQVGQEMQLEILPLRGTSETGIAIPPRAFLATPEELDDKIPAFLDGYVAAAVDITDQIAMTTAAMDKAKEAAREATKKAQEAKTPSSKPVTSAVTKPAKARDTNAGFLDSNDDDGDHPGGETASAGTSDTNDGLF